MNLIAAADENWGIGKNGGLLAHISGDMKYFRETTKGKIVVMGRKTLESFPGGKPLKNRVNIVLTGNKDFVPEGVVICHSVEETLEKLKEYPKEDVFIPPNAAFAQLSLAHSAAFCYSFLNNRTRCGKRRLLP